MLDHFPVPELGEARIQYFFHEVNDEIDIPDQYSDWLVNVAEIEGKQIYQLQVIFMPDKGLLEMNRTYLDHDYYTDIITFPLNENPLMAELYISLDRIRDNAKNLKIDLYKEIARVMVHGVLHLCGYTDENPKSKKDMRKKENYYLEML